MTDPGVTRVAVYIDFDNIVISRYDQIHGRGQFQRDKVRGFDRVEKSADPEITERLRHATVDVGAVIDFASSFGTLVLTRAYADWSAPVNADYRGQLVSRAVGLNTGSASADYISLYHGNAEMLTESLSVIQQASSTILAALFVEEQEDALAKAS